MKNYSLQDSPLYNQHSKKRLAKILFTSIPTLRRLSRENADYYITFQKEKKNGGYRDISAPIPPLKEIQSRIANLMSRIRTPNYLYAPVKGRSYVSNAATHINSRSIHLLDIENFFPSCTQNKVIWFFRTYMKCSSDIAHILSGIVCHQGSLPQGSPCSPFLAYWAYNDMWSEIAEVVDANDNILSVYADDLTISGQYVPKAAIWKITSIVKRHGHKVQKLKQRAKRDRPAEITGVIVTQNGLTVPNRQRQRLREVKKELRSPQKVKERHQLEARLRGRLTQFKQVHSANS